MAMTNERSHRWTSPLGIFMALAGAVGLFSLLTEHLTHLTQAIPFMFLLACPLMHLFGHHHGNHVGHEHEAEDGPAKAGPAADPRSQRP
jgi:hypothetical protein